MGYTKYCFTARNFHFEPNFNETLEDLGLAEECNQRSLHASLMKSGPKGRIPSTRDFQTGSGIRVFLSI